MLAAPPLVFRISAGREGQGGLDRCMPEPLLDDDRIDTGPHQPGGVSIPGEGASDGGCRCPPSRPGNTQGLAGAPLAQVASAATSSGERRTILFPARFFGVVRRA